MYAVFVVFRGSTKRALGEIKVGAKSMCKPCEQVVDEIRMREGKSAAIAARQRMEALCDRRCDVCGKPVRCDENVCTEHAR